MKIMPKYFSESAPELALAWSKTKPAVCVGPSPSTCEEVAVTKVQWQNVTDPLSNMVACLLSVGWVLLTFSSWIAPNGDTWSIPTSAAFGFCPYHVVREIQNDASMILWAGASKHYLGKGLEKGFSYEYTTQLLRKYRKDHVYDRAAALESILSGACWTPQRKYDAGLITLDENVCPLCHEVGCDEWHEYWGCPCLAK